MTYQSIDALQKTLATDVFHYAKDGKKAAGRALGTIVELITFYLLKSWGLEYNIGIEKSIPEFANEGITHNIEYAIYPTRSGENILFEGNTLPITSKKIIAKISDKHTFTKAYNNTLLTYDHILRNACIVAESDKCIYNTYLSYVDGERTGVNFAELYKKPFAIFECKRVGVEEGTKKGPQTIEKAKQGAYVARCVSALQKIRFVSGEVGGFIQRESGEPYISAYDKLMLNIVQGNESDLLKNFILTVGVVSNHGNWFTAENKNKELKVLEQSYDWLIFLTDVGIATFVNELLLSSKKEYTPVKEAFLKSYTKENKKNSFTKVKIDLAAHEILNEYFTHNKKAIASWFNIISPHYGSLDTLLDMLDVLKNKKWAVIHI